MNDFSLGIVQYNKELIPVIEKVGDSVRVLINLGPYTDKEYPVRLKLVINSGDRKVVRRTVEIYNTNYGDIGDDTVPCWEIIRPTVPRLNDLHDAQTTLRNAMNGAYGRIDYEMKKLLVDMYNQIFH